MGRHSIKFNQLNEDVLNLIYKSYFTRYVLPNMPLKNSIVFITVKRKNWEIAD